jgi:photoactive yellow protein
MDAIRLPDFDESDLARAVEALPPAALDALPFGVIRLDADGIVQIYNGAERHLSGSGDRPRLGLPFFAEVAPCMNMPSFRGRIERALTAGRFDMEFGWTGDFADAARSLRIRAQSATGSGIWLFLLREED